MNRTAFTIRRLTRRLFLAITLATTFALAGCHESVDSGAQARESIDVQTEGAYTVQTRLFPNTLTVAQTIELTVTIESPEPAEVVWPDVAAAVEPHFEVTQERLIQPENADSGAIRQSRRFELQPMLPGAYELPRLPIMIGDGELLETAPVEINVVSVVSDADSEAMAPRKDVADPPVDLRFWGLVTAGVATGAALLVAILYLLVRQARLRDDRASLRPAHEIALERLARLLATDLLAQSRFDLFLNELTVILRHYIEDRFGIHAPQQTTEEFLQAAGASGALDSERTRELAVFLNRCDLVKFARAETARHEIDSAVELVRTFIENSREIEPAASEHPVEDTREVAP